MSILDTIIENTSAARIVGEQHDVGQINYGGEAAVSRSTRSRPSGPWDAAEYGLTLEQAQAQWDAAQTPEAKEKVVADLKARAVRRASLNVTNGRVAVMVAGELPWHGLGVRVDKAAKSRQTIELAGLNWTVSKRQLSYKATLVADGVETTASMEAEGAFGIVRDDTNEFLGMVGSMYKPIQNAESFEFVDGVLASYGARYETAGALYNGSTIWLLAHLPRQSFDVVAGDTVEPYVMLTNCHDGTGAAYVYPTSVRTVCANTYRIAHRGRGKGISIRHVGDLKSKIAAGQEALGLAVESFDEFRGAADSLVHKEIDAEVYFDGVLDAVLEITAANAMKGADALAAALHVTAATQELAKAAREAAAKRFERQIKHRETVLADIVERYESERCGVGGIRGTAWSAFNAVTEHADHAKIGPQAKDLTVRQSRRFESTLAGNADELKQVAFANAMAATAV